ncbi:MAG: LacI family DNA-binding transcriptional regulator [Chloroflexota bacterium]
MAKRVTIKDVAQYAGISYQTVSRVINDKPDVSSETRQRVQEVINELNYRPSMAATSRANPKTHIIAVAVSPYNEYLLYEGDPHLLKLIQGVDHALADLNYSLLLSTIQFTNNNTIESRLLHRQLADGVVIRLSMYDHGQVATLLAKKGYPVVVIGYSQDPDIPAIRSDDENGGYLQTQHLLALGHTQIGIISGPDDDPATNMRWQGHRRAMENAGLDGSQTPYVVGDYTVDSGYRAATQLLQSTQGQNIQGQNIQGQNIQGQNIRELTAIAAFSDTMGIGAMHWLTTQGYDIPNDISIIGYDDIPNAQRQTTPLTTIHIPSMNEGQRAVQLLFDIIESRQLESKKVVLPVYLVDRSSTSVPRNDPTFNNRLI